MTQHSHISGTQEAWDRPVPSQSFATALRAKVVAEHRELAAAQRPSVLHALRWIVPPAVVMVAVVVVIAAPWRPLSADGFLQRAEAAASMMLQIDFSYVRTRELFVREENAFIGPSGGSTFFPTNTPFIRELWNGQVGDRPVLMDRISLEDGTVLKHSLLFYRPNDLAMVYPVEQYLRFQDMSAPTPICVMLEPSTEELEAHRAEIENEDKSGIGITYFNNEDMDLRFDLESADIGKRISALRQLLERGSVTEVASPERGSRVFRSDIMFNEFDKDGKQVGPSIVQGYFLFWFDEHTYRMMREEEYTLSDDVSKLSRRTEYLEHAALPKDPENVFKPETYGLVDVQTLLPFTVADLESGKAAIGCYIDKKYVGDSMALLDMGNDALWLRLISVLMARTTPPSL